LKLRRLKKVRTSQRIETSEGTVMEDASNQGRMIDDLDKDDVVALMVDKEEEKKEEEVKDDQVQGRQAEIYKIDMDHAYEGMLVAGVIEEEGDAEEHAQDVAGDAAAQGADTVVQGDDAQEPSISSPTPPIPPLQPSQDLPSTSQRLKYDKVAQALDITKLKRRVKKLEKGNRIKVLKLRRLKKVRTSQRIETSEEVVTGASESVTTVSTTISAAEPQVPTVAITTAAPVRVVAASTRRRKGVVISDPEEESTTIIPGDTKS
nr:hypothetical protein [Tanacetum cinerariifolium]